MDSDDTRPFTYVRHGRRPVTWVFLAVAIGLFTLALTQGVAWWVFIPLGLLLAITFYPIVRNPKSGTRLTAAGWDFHGGGFDRRIELASIDRVVIRSEQESEDEVVIHLDDGQEIRPPRICLPPAKVLEARLARLGIPIERA